MGYWTIDFYPKVVYAKHKPNYFYVTQVSLHESEVLVYEGNYDQCKFVCKTMNKQTKLRKQLNE